MTRDRLRRSAARPRLPLVLLPWQRLKIKNGEEHNPVQKRVDWRRDADINATRETHRGEQRLWVCLGGGRWWWWGGGPYQDRTVNAGVAIGRGLPGGVGGLFLK